MIELKTTRQILENHIAALDAMRADAMRDAARYETKAREASHEAFLITDAIAAVRRDLEKMEAQKTEKTILTSDLL